MVKLNSTNYTKYGSVQISNKNLENFAYNQLREYQKNYFKHIHSLNIDDFVEFYLKKNVQYYQLAPKKSKNRPLGATIISDGKIVIINDEGQPEIKFFKQGTIIIDEEMCGTESRRRFTLGHEAWHSQFDLFLNLKLLENSEIINDIYLDNGNYFKKANIKSPKDWIEYHADLYATYLLMPKTFVKKLYNKYHKKYFGKNQRLTFNKPKKTWLLISSIADELNVSKSALAYRLRNLNKISANILNSLQLNKKEEI